MANDWRPVTAAGAAGGAPGPAPGTQSALDAPPRVPARGGGGHGLAPRVCSAEFAAERRAGSRGTGTGCGATSRGNLAGSAAPRVARVPLRGVALVPLARAISLNNAPTPPGIPVAPATEPVVGVIPQGLKEGPSSQMIHRSSFLGEVAERCDGLDQLPQHLGPSSHPGEPGPLGYSRKQEEVTRAEGCLCPPPCPQAGYRLQCGQAF